MRIRNPQTLFATTIVVAATCLIARPTRISAQSPALQSRLAHENVTPAPESKEYQALQSRLAQGWNTWDVNSVTTFVHLPDGLAVHVGLKHNSTLAGTAFLDNALIGRLSKNAEVVTPGPHAWDGSYTDLSIAWKGHNWRIQSAHDGDDLVILATPLAPAAKLESPLPPTLVFSVNSLWNSSAGPAAFAGQGILAITGADFATEIDCTCGNSLETFNPNLPVATHYLAFDLTGPVGISTRPVGESGASRPPRTVEEIRAILARQEAAFHATAAQTAGSTQAATIHEAIETTLGWDTIYDPEKHRVISPITRVWSVDWGGWVLADWDTFFAATLAGVGSRDLAYANTIEMLHEETASGFVPNYSRPDGWKSFDRSEPPVGSITALGLYDKYRDKWFLEEAFAPLLKWNRWWAEHRDIQGYLTWGSDGENQPRNLDDGWWGTREGAILESGLDNSPMYDSVTYDDKTHLLVMGDVGLMSMYIADCDALAKIADTLGQDRRSKRTPRPQRPLQGQTRNNVG